MIENVTPFTSDAGKMSIVPSPLVIFTKQDAIRAASQAPVRELPDHENAVIVMSMITPEGVIQGTASFIVTHHAQSYRTKKQSVVGSWEVKNVPVIRGGELHHFNVNWPQE